jgi:hypothetical protein
MAMIPVALEYIDRIAIVQTRGHSPGVVGYRNDNTKISG